MKRKHVNMGDVFQTYNRLLRGTRWPFIFCFLAVAIASALSTINPWLYKLLFDAVAQGAPSSDAVAQAIQAIVWLAVVSLAGYIFWRASGFLTAWAIPRASQRLHAEAFAYLVRHSYRFYANRFAGSLVRQLNRFVDAFGDLDEVLQWEFLPLFVTMVGAVVSFSIRNGWLGAFLVVWILLYLFVNYRLALWKLKYDEARSEADSFMVGALSDVVTNSLNAKFFAAYRAEEKRYAEAVGKHIHLWRFTWNLHEAIEAIHVLLFIVLEIMILYVAVRAWGAGFLTVGDLALTQVFVVEIMQKLWGFGRNVRRVFELVAKAAEMVEVLRLPHEVVDHPGAKPLLVSHGTIDFRQVTFRYQKERPLIQRFDFSVRAGEKVALVGSSGAGKSTITKLLLRLFDVSSGAVEIDGQNIADVTLESLWKNVGFVPQEPILFHRTLRENIRYGKPNATEADVIAAAKRARCHEFILGLPDGYDTFVGERGVKLSGGERQRVAIARAILKDAPILILDEATSSLDSESELLIQQSLSELMRGKTVIAIAHRLSTIMKMDRIAVMEKGKIIEMGTHAELLQEVGMYQRLWNIQAGGFAPSSEN